MKLFERQDVRLVRDLIWARGPLVCSIDDVEKWMACDEMNEIAYSMVIECSETQT